MLWKFAPGEPFKERERNVYWNAIFKMFRKLTSQEKTQLKNIAHFYNCFFKIEPIFVFDFGPKTVGNSDFQLAAYFQAWVCTL